MFCGDAYIDLPHQRCETQCTRGILKIFGVGAHGCKEEKFGVRREAIAKQMGEGRIAIRHTS